MARPSACRMPRAGFGAPQPRAFGQVIHRTAQRNLRRTGRSAPRGALARGRRAGEQCGRTELPGAPRDHGPAADFRLPLGGARGLLRAAGVAVEVAPASVDEAAVKTAMQAESRAAARRRRRPRRDSRRGGSAVAVPGASCSAPTRSWSATARSSTSPQALPPPPRSFALCAVGPTSSLPRRWSAKGRPGLAARRPGAADHAPVLRRLPRPLSRRAGRPRCSTPSAPTGSRPGGRSSSAACRATTSRFWACRCLSCSAFSGRGVCLE